MEFIYDKGKRLAYAWVSNAEQNDPEAQKKLKNFLDDCKSKKLFACVFNSGKGNLKENTKELLAYNHNTLINRTKKFDRDAR